MADFSNKIVAPIPVYFADRDLLTRLAKELHEERDKSASLLHELSIEKHKTQQLECYLLSLANANDSQSKSGKPNEEKKKFPKNESMDTFASASDLMEIKMQVGIYLPETRRLKILKYKEKIKKYRQKVHVSRNFSGRSVVAKTKPRINGKFVKSGSVDDFESFRQ